MNYWRFKSGGIWQGLAIQAITLFISLGVARATASPPSIYETVHRFQNMPHGAVPSGTLLKGSDGAFYGTTTQGGDFAAGAVFKVDQDGSGYTVLKSFKGSDGSGPHSGLIEASDGMLYGTTQFGGASNAGTVFKLNKDGSGFTVLKTFYLATDTSNVGLNPVGRLLEGSDGAIYGTTSLGSDLNHIGMNGGVVFKISKDGSNYAILKAFTGPDGADPEAGLIEGSDGALYGTTRTGGPNTGVAFKVGKDGSGFALIASFIGTNGSYPYASLLKGSDGFLYGTTSIGGSSGWGVVFKMGQDGSGFTVLTSFTGVDAGGPMAELIEGSDGMLYGTAESSGTFHAEGVVFKIGKDGTGYAVVRTFHITDGQNPVAGLVEGADGKLYGTTLEGGAFGQGTLFKVGKDGSGFVNLKFYGQNDGATSFAALLQGSDGALYGTTSAGGVSGQGTVFKVNTNGSGYATLYSFNLGGADGQQPYGALAEGSAGALYGTTQFGGSFGFGTVFKINKDGTGYQSLHSFGAPGDGQSPYAGVIKGSDNILYGTTLSGGSATNGTIFKLNQDGSGYTVLKSFTGSDGNTPYAGLTEGSDGALYGTTQIGGAFGFGDVFKISKDGTGYTDLHDFSGDDGENPQGGLVEGLNGAMYGTTYGGGILGLNQGVVYKVGKDGSNFSVILDFGVDTSDAAPYTTLVKGAGGVLFGATHEIQGNAGKVFSVSESGSGYTRLRGFSADCFAPNGVIVGSDGMLYGTAQMGGGGNSGAVFSMAQNGTGYAVLRAFNWDGYQPVSVINASDGAMYGNTYYGGGLDLGTIYKMNPDGSGYSILKTFNGADGSYPNAPLLEGSDGKLYGTTDTGGSSNYGVLFKLNKDGSGFTVLYSFTLSLGYGSGGVIEGSDGLLYGVTHAGGANSSGIVFSIHKDGTGFAALHSFPSGAGDGYSPSAGLLQGSDGVLYGTTSGGGAQNDGTIFRINRDGTGYTNMVSLTGVNPTAPIPNNGVSPTGPLIEGLDGSLYGTTWGGGGGGGIAFRLGKNGVGYGIILEFGNIGSTPRGGLLQTSDGTLYGTASAGGDFAWGTLFSIVPNGLGYTGTKLKSFGNGDGSQPNPWLIVGSDGALYGTSGGGGGGFVYRYGTRGNYPPTLNSLGNLALTVNAGLQTVNLSGISDGDSGAQTLNVTAVSSNPSLIPNPTVNYSSPGATGSLTFTPGANATGTATITVTVQDNGGTANGGENTYQQKFTVAVVPMLMVQFPFQNNATQISSKGFQLTLGVVPGVTYRVQVSTDLKTWTDVSSFTASGASVSLLDASAVNHPHCYYRMVSP